MTMTMTMTMTTTTMMMTTMTTSTEKMIEKAPNDIPEDHSHKGFSIFRPNCIFTLSSQTG